MISKRIIINLIVFFAASVGLIVYGAVTLFGNPLEDPRTLSADLPDAGGLRTGFSVSHDGVVVGTVSKVDLRKGGVRVSVELDPGISIPGGVEARIVRASAVGEQRLDFASTTNEPGDPLPDGAVVPAAPDPVPPDVADVLAATNRLFDALPADDLNTLVHELAVGIDGRSGDLKSITRSLTSINDDFVELEPDLRALLEDGPGVLDDFSEMSPSAHAALANTQALTRILADRDEDLVKLLGDGADLATTFDRVLLDNRAALTCLTRNVKDINRALQGEALANLDRAFVINQLFFGTIEKVAVRGEAANVGYGPAQDKALWLRSRLLVPPAEPHAIRYAPPRAPRPVTTGAACQTGYGAGSDAVAAPATSPYDPQDRAPVSGSSAASGAGPSGAQGGEDDSSIPDFVPFAIGAGALAAMASYPTLRNRWRAS